MFRLTYINYRYSLFEKDGCYYLLDRKPSNLLGYLYGPLQWKMPKNIYALTTKEGHILLDHNLKIRWGCGCSSVFAGGLGATLGQTMSRANVVEGTAQSITDTALRLNLLLAFLMTAVLVPLIFFLQARAVQKLIHLREKVPLKGYVVPRGPRKKIYKAILLPLPFWLMIASGIYVYMDSRSWLFLLGTGLFFFILVMSSANVFNIELSYDFNRKN